MSKSISIALSVAVCLFVGYLSNLLQAESLATWYPTLNKAPLTPPGWVFAVVWSILYVLIGISAGLLLAGNNITKRLLLALFVVQLFFNLLWSFCFFTMQSVTLGVAVLFMLVVMALAYFFGAFLVERMVAYFFLPYLLWLFFACYLNIYMAMFN